MSYWIAGWKYPQITQRIIICNRDPNFDVNKLFDGLPEDFKEEFTSKYEISLYPGPEAAEDAIMEEFKFSRGVDDNADPLICIIEVGFSSLGVKPKYEISAPVPAIKGARGYVDGVLNSKELRGVVKDAPIIHFASGFDKHNWDEDIRVNRGVDDDDFEGAANDSVLAEAKKNSLILPLNAFGTPLGCAAILLAAEHRTLRMGREAARER